MFVRRLVSGVRSSWEASATSCRCARIDSSSAPSIVLKLPASRASSSPPETSIRLERSRVSATSSVARVSRRTGTSTARVTARPSAGRQPDPEQRDRDQQPAEPPERAVDALDRADDLDRDAVRVAERVHPDRDPVRVRVGEEGLRAAGGDLLDPVGDRQRDRGAARQLAVAVVADDLVVGAAERRAVVAEDPVGGQGGELRRLPAQALVGLAVELVSRGEPGGAGRERDRDRDREGDRERQPGAEAERRHRPHGSRRA